MVKVVLPCGAFSFQQLAANLKSLLSLLRTRGGVELFVQTSLLRAAGAALEVATAAREEAVTRRRAAMGAGVSITPEQLEVFELEVQRCQAAVLEAQSTLERLQQQSTSNEQVSAFECVVGRVVLCVSIAGRDCVSIVSGCMR